MRKLISLLIILLVTCGIFMNHAQAKRFGGGRSFGVQRSVSSFSRLQPLQNVKQRAFGNRWLGPLTGLLTGGFLAYLLMGHGIGAGILTWIIIGGLLFLVMGFLRNRTQMATQPTHYNYENLSQGAFSQSINNHSQNGHTVFPTAFDRENFLRDAKVQFIRLQAAYDAKNLNDLREFTTPEVYAEIQMQLQERGDAANFTEVIRLDAELLDAENELNTIIAQVKFSGVICEDINESGKPFTEIWNFKKEDANWRVAGIQ